MNEKIWRVRPACITFFMFYLGIWLVKTISSYEVMKTSNFIVSGINFVLQALLIVLSYRGQDDNIVKLVFIQLMYQLILMADPWNKGRYRSHNHTTIMLIANFMACFIHMNNLNVLLHKNLIFIVYTLVIGALFCCTQWFFIRQDDY